VILFYRVIRLLFRALLSILFRWRVEGRENVPATGGVILASNHISWWDPPVVGCSVSRPVRFMAKAELFRIPVLGPAIRNLGAFPIRRGKPDRQALRIAVNCIEAGEVLGMFPEGTRIKGDELGRAQDGIGFIALRTNAPIVPVAIVADYRLRSEVRVIFGESFRAQDVVDPDLDRKEAMKVVGGRIMDCIKDLKTRVEGK